MLFRVRADGTILDFEQGRELEPASPPEAFLGRAVQDVLPGPIGGACQSAIARALETREIRSYEYEFTHDGRSQTHAATICPDTEDEVVIAVRDLTRTRRVEEDLRRSEHLASIGALAAGIAHEVNNPIGAALAAAQYGLACRQDANAISVMDEALQDVVRETVRCGRIVKNLLKLARSEPGERWATDPNRLLRQATELSRDYAASLGVELVLESSHSTRPCTVSPLEIETALMNVIRNAIEATSPGGRVCLHTEAAARGVRFVIRDQGCGIQPADRDRVVEPFFTTRREAGGTGLGLSIAQAAIASHEGSLSIQSEAGRGTTVLIFVPYGAQSLAEHERE
jgi:signal transduction histidine kinase